MSPQHRKSLIDSKANLLNLKEIKICLLMESLRVPCNTFQRAIFGTRARGCRPLRYGITNRFHGILAIVSQLQNICNKFIRVSFNLASEDDILPFMRRHNLLTIKDIFIHDVAVIMYKYHQGALPPAFDDMFRSKISSIKTRSNSQLIPAFYRSTVSQQSIRCVGPKVWSEIPIAIKKSRTISAFKKKLKQHFINGY